MNVGSKYGFIGMEPYHVTDTSSHCVISASPMMKCVNDSTNHVDKFVATLMKWRINEIAGRKKNYLYKLTLKGVSKP